MGFEELDRDQNESPETRQEPESVPAAARNRPTKSLPTPRISFPKQVDILRAYAAQYEAEHAPVMLAQIARLTQMASSTVSLANPFLQESGLITRSEGGMTPSPALRAYGRMLQWGDETAAGEELGDVLEQTWFAKLMLPVLAMRPVPDDEARRILGSAANAGPNYRNQIDTLIDYLQLAGLARRDGTMIHAGRASSKPPSTTAPASPEPETAKRTTSTAPSVGQVPTLVRGLLEQLPNDGRWSRDKMERWLDLARLTFEVVYEIEPAKQGGQGEETQ
jgi:hypothetical protein